MKKANKTCTSLQPLRHDRCDADSRISNTFGYSFDHQTLRFHKLQVLSETFFSQSDIYWGNMKNVRYDFFGFWPWRCLFMAPIFMVIFVISKSKYAGIRSFKATGGIPTFRVYFRPFGSTPLVWSIFGLLIDQKLYAKWEKNASAIFKMFFSVFLK